jgi:hypothetical protein
MRSVTHRKSEGYEGRKDTIDGSDAKWGKMLRLWMRSKDMESWRRAYASSANCKQVIDTQKEQYVVLAPQASRAAEVIAHVTCEQDRVKKKARGRPSATSHLGNEFMLREVVVEGGEIG